MATQKRLLHHRLFTAIRSRDWFGVGIEVFAVVLGVLLGLQASQWADDRAAARAREALEARLATDLLAYAKGVRSTAKIRRERLDAMIRLDEWLDAGSIRTAERKTVLRGIDGAFNYDDVRPLPLSFSEMIGGGSLERLDDPEVRRQLESMSRLHARFVESGRLLNDGTFDLYLELQPQVFSGNAAAQRRMIERSVKTPDQRYPLDTPIDWGVLEGARFRHALDLAVQRDTYLAIFGTNLAGIAEETAGKLGKDR